MRKWTPVPRHVGLFSYDTQKGKRYGVRRGFKNADGKRDEFTKSGFRNWRDADVVLKDFESRLAKRELNPLSGQKILLGDYFDRMAERKIKYGVWRPSTADTNTRYFDNHIRPIFGSRRMAEITRTEYQLFLDSLDDHDHMSKTSIYTVHRVMMAVINAAVAEDILTKNTLNRMEIHGKEAKSVAIAPEAFDRWFIAAQKLLDPYNFAMISIATIGLRRGEVFGLRANSIAFQTDETTGKEVAAIKVDMQRTETWLDGGPLKNTTSYRTLWVKGAMIDYLHFAILTSDNLRKINGVPDTSKKWLWVNTVGRPVSAQYLKAQMDIVNDATGLHIRPHMFRHYFASRSVNTPASEIEVMHYLGHKNLQMTADYTRPTQSASLDVFSNFESVARKASSDENEKPDGTK